MAENKDIKITAGITYVNGGLADTVAQETTNITQAAQEFYAQTVSVGSGAEEDLTLTDITTNGFVYLKNLDPTNYVKYGPKSGGVMIEFGRLKAGERTVLRLASGVTWRWIADTAAVKVLVKAYGN